MTTWDNTQEGSNLSGAWDSFRDLYQKWLPAHRARLQAAANRPINR